jgi:aspartate aminotransferase
MQEAMELKSRGIDVIDLGPGEPDFPTPVSIKEAGIRAVKTDFTRYTPAAGTRELRAGLAKDLNRKWGTNFSASNVIVTCGAKHAIFNVCMTVFERGDEVLIPSPYWVTFPEVIKMTGATPVDVETSEENGFVLTVEAVRGRLSGQTKGLIVNTPNNPTGALIPQQTIEELVQVSRAKEIFMIFDETYEYLTYDGHQHSSIASCTDLSLDAFALIGSFSKTYSMTGWRVGYCVGPEELIRKLGQLQSHQTGNPTSISQMAALEALASGTGELELMRLEYEQRRQLILELINQIPGFRCATPYGAFYAFPNVTDAMKKLGLSTSQEFSKFLIQEARVATVPGSAFGIEGYIRISYATSVENLSEGINRIKKAVSGNV